MDVALGIPWPATERVAKMRLGQIALAVRVLGDRKINQQRVILWREGLRTVEILQRAA